MRTEQRLRALKKWLEAEVCAGRQLKAPGISRKLQDVSYREPPVYLMFDPLRNEQGAALESTAPSLLIMPAPSHAMSETEQRFDRYSKISRPDEMAQTLRTTLLFTIYEPGIRLKGFYESALRRNGADPKLLLESTEQGVFTLYNWIDDCVEKLMGTIWIPDTDMTVDKKSITYSPYVDQNYVVDKRPIYYGMVDVTFVCHVDAEPNRDLLKILN